MGERYAHSREACYDSILSSAPVGSYEYDYAAVEKKLIWDYLPGEAIDGHIRLLETHQLSDHEKAINCSLLSNAYKGVANRIQQYTMLLLQSFMISFVNEGEYCG